MTLSSPSRRLSLERRRLRSQALELLVQRPVLTLFHPEQRQGVPLVRKTEECRQGPELMRAEFEVYTRRSKDTYHCRSVRAIPHPSSRPPTTHHPLCTLDRLVRRVLSSVRLKNEAPQFLLKKYFRTSNASAF